MVNRPSASAIAASASLASSIGLLVYVMRANRALRRRQTRMFFHHRAAAQRLEERVTAMDGGPTPTGCGEQR